MKSGGVGAGVLNEDKMLLPYDTTNLPGCFLTVLLEYRDRRKCLLIGYKSTTEDISRARKRRVSWIEQKGSGDVP